MAENKLPSGVGKKIVQALKKQAEVEIQPVSDTVDMTNPVIKNAIDYQAEKIEKEIVDNSAMNSDFTDFSVENSAEEDFSSIQEDPINESFEESFPSDFNNNFGGMNFEEQDSSLFEEKEIFKPAASGMSGIQNQKTYAVPANVAVLKRLIMQLPQGVSKQTGAQIIRQTMEALGISMNSVLKEAQQGQDSITASAKACLATIAEYKNNIRGLEKQVQDYKKQAIALNDLISLFVMTEK